MSAVFSFEESLMVSDAHCVCRCGYLYIQIRTPLQYHTLAYPPTHTPAHIHSLTTIHPHTQTTTHPLTYSPVHPHIRISTHPHTRALAHIHRVSKMDQGSRTCPLGSKLCPPLLRLLTSSNPSLSKPSLFDLL